MDQPLLATAESAVKMLGLPTLFCLWLMFRMEKKQDEQTAELKGIGTSLSAILEHVRKGG